jgi:hypothetical protein
VNGTVHLAEELLGAGLEGLEALHAQHSAAERETLSRAAERLGLIVTGGSDFHGEDATATRLGDGAVPDEVLEALIARAGDRGRRHAQAT